MKPAIALSINPTYYCNFRCSFCYLTKEQLSDTETLSHSELILRLEEIQEHYKISHVDLYGGELLLLKNSYIDELLAILEKYNIKSIGLNTNLSGYTQLIEDTRVYVSVSYDFTAREQHDIVFKNMLRIQRPFAILMLASKELLATPIVDILNKLDLLKNLSSIEVKPYSKNQSNQLDINYTEYETFVKKLIIATDDKPYTMVNKSHLDNVVYHRSNSYSNDHIYITPKGKLAVLEFDLNDNEYFKTVDTITDFQEWCVTEKARIESNSHCTTCKYIGRCLSEHLRDVRSLDKSCNGFYHLINWYENDYKTSRQQTETWRMTQELYSQLITEHNDDREKQPYVIHEEILENAKAYFLKKDWIAVYPAKAYAVAVIYALLFKEYYNRPIHKSLNDPELFYGGDNYFVTYNLAKPIYDELLSWVSNLPNWKQAGWAPFTVQYFLAECTEEGFEQAVAYFYNTGTPLVPMK